mmetsp:Transcript_22997/g.57731  ORF Transcript_22997/g.57731 Transcript_22997/m.57731 type:complete len:175 (-) Transcript_22997:826-1350(-)
MDDLKWDSVKWSDGSTYEGLARLDKCEVRGVMTYPNGDRYEGEFADNRMEGYGVYIWGNGTIYRGEWQKGKMQGCGVRLARQSTREGPVFSAEEGMFMDDEWVGDIMACNAEQSRAAAYEADVASSMARAFQVSGKPRPSQQVAAATSTDTSLAADSQPAGATEVRRKPWYRIF